MTKNNFRTLKKGMYLQVSLLQTEHFDPDVSRAIESEYMKYIEAHTSTRSRSGNL